jgi:hypothetical protein
MYYNRAVIIAILYDIKQRELYTQILRDKIRDLLTSKDI